jgi:hypothetical protein
MIGLSLAGLLGAIAGTVIAALSYGALVTLVERGLRANAPAQMGDDERARFEETLALARRGVLALDVLIFGGLGYWLGSMLGA